MTKIKIGSHTEICPEGAEIEVNPGENLCEILLDRGISIEHACELSCACTTCHVIVRNGFSSLDDASEAEEDMLDKAWGLESQSRLGCQILVGEEDLEIEIPRYTINMVSESH